MGNKNKNLKIKTTYGKILTITVEKEENGKIFGRDKFGDYVIVPLVDISSMIPYDGVVG